MSKRSNGQPFGHISQCSLTWSYPSSHTQIHRNGVLSTLHTDTSKTKYSTNRSHTENRSP